MYVFVYLHMYTYMYTYIHTYIYTYIHVCIYIYRERERSNYICTRVHVAKVRSLSLSAGAQM